MKLTQEQIDDKVDEWHNSNTNMLLHEYLGMTWDEYKEYIENNIIADSVCPLHNKCRVKDIASCKDFWNCLEFKIRSKT